MIFYFRFLISFYQEGTKIPLKISIMNDETVGFN